MKFIALILTAIVPLAAAVESVHFANCQIEPDTPGANGDFSQMIYYAEDADSNNGQAVSTTCVTSGTGGYFHWEGHFDCTFPSSGVRFQGDLSSTAASASTGASVGGAWNGYKTFTCHKDNGRTLWNEVVYQCESIYYCLAD